MSELIEKELIIQDIEVLLKIAKEQEVHSFVAILEGEKNAVAIRTPDLAKSFGRLQLTLLELSTREIIDKMVRTSDEKAEVLAKAPEEVIVVKV